MKVGKLAIAAVAASALVLAGCSSSDSDSAAESTDDVAASEDSEDSGDSGGTGPKICMVTHGDGGGFWSVAKAGADKAGEDLPVQFTYQETTNDAQLQAQLIESFISEGCEGIAVSAPNPDAISDALAKADEAGIAIVTMNSGSKVIKDLGAFTHVGQDEFIAGQEAGLKFKEAGKSKVLCPIQEQNNIGLQERCDGAADTFGNVENLQLSAGLADIAQSQAEIQAKLEAEAEIVQGSFASVDTDGNGMIDVDELRRFMAGSGAADVEAELQRMLAKLDVNNDGQISFEEFLGHHLQTTFDADE